MKFTHTDANDTTGTHLQGYLRGTYDEIVAVFGAPDHVQADGKVQAEWCLKFADGTIATIYDWKAGVSAEEVEEWNVGGFDMNAYHRIATTFLRGE